MNYKLILTSITIIILVIILRNTILSIHNLIENEGTVQDLHDVLDAKKKENEFLTQRLSYVKSNEFVEHEARKKLGLVRENEYPVFVMPPNNNQEISELNQKPNWVKWKEVFKL